ncbi:alpha/beta-hydrolase [Panus rudis PR-1116 ss-1]|nr:alpha/beta-hydrolase [Panus rudis PR-1116 ss-1]
MGLSAALYAIYTRLTGRTRKTGGIDTDSPNTPLAEPTSSSPSSASPFPASGPSSNTQPNPLSSSTLGSGSIPPSLPSRSLGEKKTRDPGAPYGTWESPISAGMSLSGGVEDIFLDPVTSKVYFAQKRPGEGNSSLIPPKSRAICAYSNAYNLLSCLHEYGGAAAVVFNDVLYFSNFDDGRVYMYDLKNPSEGVEPRAITPESSVLRYASFTVHPVHTHLLICTVEDHTDPHPSRVRTYLGLIDARKPEEPVKCVVEGADFYACARFGGGAGRWICWQQWNFPELPFQSSEIYVAPPRTSIEMDNGNSSTDVMLSIGTPIHVAGKHGTICAQDPKWTSETSIHFVCDLAGYLNPWKFDKLPPLATPILPYTLSEEFGAPQWWLSKHGSGSLSSTHIIFLSYRQARSRLYIADTSTTNPELSFREIETEYVNVQYLHGDGRGKVVALGQCAGRGEELVDNSNSDHTTNRVCHITYYPPRNPLYETEEGERVRRERGEKPPVVVLMHGGPFYMEPAALDWSKQFWTTRGWAHVDVNYAGSSGFGRAYRESLHGKWGLLDILDAHQSILALSSPPLSLLDPTRAVVHGGSAGGYAVLQLATMLPDAFAAGSPHYGISDMKKLDECLHKFEWGLCERLGDMSDEEKEKVWRERSPIWNVDKIRMPMLILQGKQDTVIPAEQMIEMVDTIKSNGGKCELVLFDGEGHGWRKAETIRSALEREEVFFEEVLGLRKVGEEKA